MTITYLIYIISILSLVLPTMLWGYYLTFQTRRLGPWWWTEILKQNHSFQALISLAHLTFLEYSAANIYLINTSWYMIEWLLLTKILISCEIFITASKKTEQTPPIFHELLWLLPAFQESSPTTMRSTNLLSGTNIFSILRTPLLCPHGTLINVVQRVNGFVINHYGLTEHLFWEA